MRLGYNKRGPREHLRRIEEDIISQPTVARSTAIMSVSTTLSRVTGFVRTWTIAYALGVTALSSAYSVANNIPNMIFELVAGGVISSLFIPIFLEQWEKRGEEDAWEYASYLFNLTTIALAVVAVFGTVYAEQFVRTQTFRSGSGAAEVALAGFFFRFFAVQIVFYGAGAVISGLLNAKRNYLWPALGPVFNNLVVIVTLLGFYVPFRHTDPELAKMGLAIGTTLGVLAMFAVQVPALIKMGFRYTPRIDLRHPGLRRMGRMALPTLVYVVTNLVAVSFRNAYAFEVSPEGPATLLYAWMFYQLPYGIFAVALATAIFTELSDQAGRDDWPSFKSTFSRGFKATGMLIIPMAAMLIALSEPLIRLYRAGAFTASDVPVVAEILAWWGATLFFFAGYMFILKTFYSLQDTRTPMLVNLVLTVGQVGMYATLTVGFAGWGGFGLKGIPIADMVFFAVSLAVLALLLRRKIGGYDVRGVVWMLTRTTIAAAVGGLAAYGVLRLTPGLAAGTTGFLLQLLLGGVVGLGVAFGGASLLRVEEVGIGTDLIRRLFARLGQGA